jgi:hypothetical protein
MLLYFLFCRFCSLLEHIFHLKAVECKIILYVAIFLKWNLGQFSLPSRSPSINLLFAYVKLL